MNFDPSDRELERAGAALCEKPDALVFARKLFTYDELLDLIITYADSDAVRKLDELRMQFWGDDAVQEMQNELIAAYREHDGEP